MGKRLLITGGAGFIGSHVSEYFLERGWSLDIIDDLSTGKRHQVPATATFHEMDVRSPDAARVLRDGGFDVIVHLAAQMDVRRSVDDPVHDASVNVIGTLNLLEALRVASSKARFVFSSTGGAVYGDFVTPPNEERFPKDPESPYAISKLSAEFYLAYYSRLHHIEAIPLRLANVYGPRQDPHGEAGVVAIFCNRLLTGQQLTIFGDGKQTRDYVYVRDVAAAVHLAATRPLPAPGRLDDRAFNIGTGVATSVNDLARTLVELTECKAELHYAPPRLGEQQHSSLEVSKAAALLGWRAATDLQAGLRESFRWFEAQHHSHVVRT